MVGNKKRIVFIAQHAAGEFVELSFLHSLVSRGRRGWREKGRERKGRRKEGRDANKQQQENGSSKKMRKGEEKGKRSNFPSSFSSPFISSRLLRRREKRREKGKGRKSYATTSPYVFFYFPPFPPFLFIPPSSFHPMESLHAVYQLESPPPPPIYPTQFSICSDPLSNSGDFRENRLFLFRRPEFVSEFGSRYAARYIGGYGK